MSLVSSSTWSPVPTTWVFGAEGHLGMCETSGVSGWTQWWGNSWQDRNPTVVGLLIGQLIGQDPLAGVKVDVHPVPNTTGHSAANKMP